MKLFIVLCLVAMAVAAPQREYTGAQILRYDNENYGGSYKYAYEQSDGTKAEQQGELKNEGREDVYIVVRGSFTWISPENIKYTVTYTADENGYKPEIEESPGISYSPALTASLLGR